MPHIFIPALLDRRPRPCHRRCPQAGVAKAAATDRYDYSFHAKHTGFDVKASAAGGGCKPHPWHPVPRWLHLQSRSTQCPLICADAVTDKQSLPSFV